jgi:hypothetical protein
LIGLGAVGGLAGPSLCWMGGLVATGGGRGFLFGGGADRFAGLGGLATFSGGGGGLGLEGGALEGGALLTVTDGELLL